MAMKRTAFSYMIHNIFSLLRPLFGGASLVLVILYTFALFFSLTVPALAADPSSGPLPLTLDLSGNVFEVNTTTQSIPENGTFAWTVGFTPSEKAKSAQIVFEVRRETGSLIFKRTMYVNDISAAREGFLTAQPAPTTPYIQTLDFTRELAGLSMVQGSYKISVEATVDSGSVRETAVLNSTQFVYAPKIPPLKTILGVRYSLPPLRDTEGIFSSDPAGGDSETLRLALHDLITTAEQHSIKPTIFLSPLLFSEWSDIADGYKVRDSNGKPVDVLVDSATAKKYAETLALFKRASDSGAISRGLLGFADPNLAKLADATGPALIDAQYQRARQVFETEDFTPATSTAPLGSNIGEAQLDRLFAQDLKVVMLGESSLSKKTAGLSLYKDKLAILKIDTELSKQLVELKNHGSAQEALFATHTSKDYRNDYLPLFVNITTPEEARAFSLSTTQIARAPWIKIVSADAVEKESAPTAKLSAIKAPVLTKEDLKAAEAALAGAGAVAALPQDARALRIRDRGLIAQNASPTPVSKRASAEGMRLAYAESAIESTRELFSDVVIKISPVTLSGNSGVVPITINNGSKTPMNVVVSMIPGPGMSIQGDDRVSLTLPPQETFLEPAITLSNRVRSDLTVVVSAGSYTICEKSVDIGASYIDTIAIIAIVTLVGFGLLFYIYRSVKYSDR